MFDDLHGLTGKELGREVIRQLYGADKDPKPAAGYQSVLECDVSWAVNVGHGMKRHYNEHAAKLGLPLLLSYDHGPMEKDGRRCELRLDFVGGFTVRYQIGDPLEYGLHTGLVLHRLLRQAGRQLRPGLIPMIVEPLAKHEIERLKSM